MKPEKYFDSLLTKSWKKYINKFTISLFLFAIWMIFFDNYNLRTQSNLKRIINELSLEKEKFSHLYEKAIEERKVLQNDQERYAREKYFMHKDNEDIFIINKNKVQIK